jgi:MFS family permease
MAPSREYARARVAVTLMFLLNGVGWSSLIPRYPELKNGLGLDDLSWGLVVGVGPLGGLLAGLFTARLMRRFNSSWVWLASTLVGLSMLNVSGNAVHWAMFAVGLITMAAMDALADIAMNAHGLRVQRGYGRSILNGLHGWWSVGAVIGGFLGSTAAQLGVPIWAQALVGFVAFAAAALYARSLALPGPDAEPVTDPTAPTHGRGIPRRWLPRLLALGLLGASAGLIEDSGASWGGVYLESQFTVAPFVVGMAFVALQGSQMIGRFTGDALTNRIGPRAAVTQGMLIAAVGMGLAVAFPTPVTTLIGFACAGWGIATAIPGAMHAADELPGMLHGNGLTFVTWLMRVGFFVGPPLIGLVAQYVNLRWALLVIPVTAALGLLLSPALTPPRHAASPAADGGRPR